LTYTPKGQPNRYDIDGVFWVRDCSTDLSIVFLKDPIPASSFTTEFLRIDTDNIADTLIGKKVTMVGFGWNGRVRSTCLQYGEATILNTTATTIITDTKTASMCHGDFGRLNYYFLIVNI
jgi:hypothetical protein